MNRKVSVTESKKGRCLTSGPWFLGFFPVPSEKESVTGVSVFLRTPLLPTTLRHPWRSDWDGGFFGCTGRLFLNEILKEPRWFLGSPVGSEALFHLHLPGLDFTLDWMGPSLTSPPPTSLGVSEVPPRQWFTDRIDDGKISTVKNLGILPPLLKEGYREQPLCQRSLHINRKFPVQS